MQLVKRQLSLELARHDRVEMLSDLKERADRVVSMSRLMPEADRRLVDLIFVRGVTHRAAAAELQLAPGVVTRRIQRLRNRLASPTHRAIADHLQTLPPPARQIAVDHFFTGLTIAAIRGKLGMTRRDVQAQVDFVRGWARGAHREALRGATRAAEARDDDDE